MKLSKCVMGVIVIDKDNRLGHVVGLGHSADYPGAENNSGEVLPLVKWSYKELPNLIHYKNIELYKD